ncbi:MAG TPA: VOC family protein [Stenomitos sp.]
MQSFIIACFAALCGYVAAYVPALQLPLPQALHRWHPSIASAQATQPIAIQGVGWVGTRTPYTQDTVAFFRDLLQLPVTHQGTHFTEFTLGSGERLAVVGMHAPDTSFMKGPMLEFRVNDAAQVRSQLEAAGVKFIGDIHRDAQSGFTWTEFWGPDGYAYGLTDAPLIGENHR